MNGQPNIPEALLVAVGAFFVVALFGLLGSILYHVRRWRARRRILGGQDR